MLEEGCGGGFGDQLFFFWGPFFDDEVGWASGRCGVDAEPDAVTDRVGGCGAGEDEVPARWEVFDALESGRCGEGEEVDSAKGAGGDVEQ